MSTDRTDRIDESTMTVKYAIITFGCRVNQADSLGFEERAAAPAALGRVARGSRPRRREHLLGDRVGRSRRAADDPSHRARQSRRAQSSSPAAMRREGRRKSRRCRMSLRSCRTTTSRIRCVVRVGDWLDDRGTVRRRRGKLRRRHRAGRGGRTAFTLRVQTGCAEPCCVLHHPDDARRAAQRASRRRASARSIGSRRPASRKSRSRACISARTAAI